MLMDFLNKSLFCEGILSFKMLFLINRADPYRS